MKDKKFSFKGFGIGLLTIIFYFLFSNFLMTLLLKKYPGNNKIFSVYYLIVSIATLLVVFSVYRIQIIKYYNDFKKHYKEYIKTAFGYWIKGFFIMIVSNYILTIILKIGQSTNELENIALLKNSIIAHSINILLVAPFLEEIVFRLSFNKMSQNKHIFSFITGIIFGFIHIITSLSLKNPLNILILIPYSAMGVALGYAYKETDNIFSSLFMHILHNSISLFIIIISIIGGLI